MRRYPSLSVCMIVKDEEKNLPRLLSSIKGLADEVIVVDTGSADSTVSIARTHGARVYRFEWCDDFAAARNESLRRATKDYVLWLDADDEVMAEEHRKIRNHLRRYSGSAVYLTLDVDGKGRNQAMQLRIFPNHRGVRFTGRIHEQAIPSINENRIPVSTCDATIVHHGYTEPAATRAKFLRNIRLLEMDLADNPDDVAALYFLARTYAGLGNAEEVQGALSYYDRIIELARDNPAIRSDRTFRDMIIDKSKLLSDLGRKEEAISLMVEHRSLCAEFPLFHHFLGQLYVESKDYEKAFEELLPLKGKALRKEFIPVDIHETAKSFHRNLGISAMFAQEFQVAEECLKAAVESDPSDSVSYHFLSLARETKGDLDEAIEACREGLVHAEGDGSLQKRLFLLHVKKEDFRAALQAFEKLNGNRTDTDAICGRFLISCKALDAAGIIRDYGIIQNGLSIEPQKFPQNIAKVKEELRKLNDAKAAELFDSAVSFLLSQTA